MHPGGWYVSYCINIDTVADSWSPTFFLPAESCICFAHYIFDHLVLFMVRRGGCRVP